MTTILNGKSLTIEDVVAVARRGEAVPWPFSARFPTATSASRSGHRTGVFSPGGHSAFRQFASKRCPLPAEAWPARSSPARVMSLQEGGWRPAESLRPARPIRCVALAPAIRGQASCLGYCSFRALSCGLTRDGPVGGSVMALDRTCTRGRSSRQENERIVGFNAPR